MSQNCKSSCTRAVVRDANNNTLYSGANTAGYGSRGYSPPAVNSNPAYQQVTAKVVLGSVTAINDLKLPEKHERELRRAN